MRTESRWKLCPLILACVLGAEKVLAVELPRIESLRIGSDWSQEAVDGSELEPDIAQNALSIAKFRGGTSIYLGKFNGNHLIATNAHLAVEAPLQELPNGIAKYLSNPEKACFSKGTRLAFRFTGLKKNFECKRVLGIWSEIELAVYSISVPQDDESHLDQLGVVFDFQYRPQVDDVLYLLGYGTYRNPSPPNNTLLISRNRQCKVFSETVKLMRDPDAKLQAPYSAWSFANGCSVSWGNSGSGIFLQSTSKAIGVLWTAAFPKRRAITSDDSKLERAIERDPRIIWTQLSYGVPAFKIKEVIERDLRSTTSASSMPIDAETLAAWLQSEL